MLVVHTNFSHLLVGVLFIILFFSVEDQILAKEEQLCKTKPPLGYDFGTCITEETAKEATNRTRCLYFFSDPAKNCQQLYSAEERPLMLGESGKEKKKS